MIFFRMFNRIAQQYQLTGSRFSSGWSQFFSALLCEFHVSTISHRKTIFETVETLPIGTLAAYALDLWCRSLRHIYTKQLIKLFVS